MHERTANLLGAAALAVSDLLLRGATAAAGVSESGAAALVVLLNAPGVSVTELGRRVGLSQPAAARMVETLERRGLVERRPTLTRSVAVHPTETGARAGQDILSSRGGPLRELVESLDNADRARLEDLLSTLLGRVYTHIPEADFLCRLCDGPACVADDHTCPVSDARRSADG
jgi:MarR family transcriptional regulator, negative regulator of the multidrug operon emrRAB